MRIREESQIRGTSTSNANLSKVFRRHLTEMFLSHAGEVVKLYSSVHRVHTYQRPDEIPVETGAKRDFRTFSRANWLNPFTPHISIEAYEQLREDKNLWSAYQNQVLRKDIVEENPELFVPSNPDYLTNSNSEPTFLRLIHNLESSWLHHRAYHKLFSDLHKRTKTFLDLESFSLTHSNQFFMREFLGYLEGNYVVSVRGTGKVYVPHLQASLDSVDLPYTSAYGIGHGDAIADYLTKSGIKNTADLLAEFDKMVAFEAEVIGGYKDRIFLNSSHYVDSDKYLNMVREWLQIIGEALPVANFNDRSTIKSTINQLIEQNKLTTPSDLFNTNAPEIKEVVANYDDDRFFFCDLNPASAIKNLLRRVFVSLIEYSINRYRMESRGGPGSDVERTEYETVFRRYRDMTELEQRLNCLLVEDGEISLVLMLSRYFLDRETIRDIKTLKKWGLVEPSQGRQGSYMYSARAKRMARWFGKIAGWTLAFGRASLDFSKNDALRANYDPLSEMEDALFHWTRTVQNEVALRQLLSEIALSDGIDLEEAEVIAKFQNLCNMCVEAQENTVEAHVSKRSRFNKELNEFLRASETISRSVVAIPTSTIPTELEGMKEKIFGFSIFIGTFHFSDGLDDDEHFAPEATEIEEILRAAKSYFTLIGKPATEVLNRFIVEEESSKRVARNVGKSAHALKNLGVAFRAQIDTLKNTVPKETQYAGILARVVEFEKEFERMSGAIQLLNLAANPFQAKYLDKRPYCLLDVILQAYCSAFEQFLIAGPKLELAQMRDPHSGHFLSPVLQVSVDNQVSSNKYTVQRKLRHCPKIPEVSYDQPYTNKFDAEEVLTGQQIFEDRLPERLILLNAYLEIFNNALRYARKGSQEVMINVDLVRHNKEIVVKISNESTQESLRQLETTTRGIEEQSRSGGAGIDTNALFFKNSGGEFRMVADFQNSRATAISRINLDYLRGFRQ